MAVGQAETRVPTARPELGTATEPGGAPSPRSLWAIVLNWRRADLALECVSLLVRNKEVTHVLVVDNGSGRHEVERLESALSDIPKCSVLATGTNLGYAGGMQSGIRVAMRAGADYVWLVNNDALPREGSLAPLVAEMEANPRTGACSGIIEHPDSGWSHGGGKLDLIHARFINQYSQERASRDRYVVDWVPGDAWLIRSAALRTVGGLDCRLFLYGEEADWCYRAKRAGYSAVVVTSARISALQSVTANTVPCESRFYIERNKTWLLRRQGTAQQKLLHFAVLATYRLPRSLGGAALRGQWRCVSLLLRAFWAGATQRAAWSDRPEDAVSERLPSLEIPPS